jgi:hypothetical protein
LHPVSHDAMKNGEGSRDLSPLAKATTKRRFQIIER